MAAFTGTPASSVEYAKIGTRDLNAFDTQANLQVSVANYTHAGGAGTGEINLVKLPAGKIRIHSHLSKIWASQFATSADLHLGYRAYVGGDGVTVIEDDNAFADNLDVAAAAIDATFALPSALGEYLEFDTQDGLILFALVDTGNIEDADTINLVVVYSTIE